MTTKKATDADEAAVQKAVDEAEDTGFIGEKVDPLPNERYSTKTGPESPTAAEQRAALKEAE